MPLLPITQSTVNSQQSTVNSQPSTIPIVYLLRLTIAEEMGILLCGEG
ncbi:hypothetical protein H6G64_07480 [Calothrix sp. FACHB-156]|nr:hypothetical protein [Calothrix sp. FACHB-156]